MNQAFKTVLQRLKRSRPKLSDETIAEFAMTVKAMSIADILAACRELTTGKKNLVAASEDDNIESAVKRRLREVGGRASDFLPYLEEALNEAALHGNAQAVRMPKKATLGQAIGICKDLLGTQARATIQKALDRYVSENDTSYQFKSV